MRAGGPIQGIRVLELAAMGPVPFAGTFLRQLGADVTLIERPGEIHAPQGPRRRAAEGKTVIGLDLKQPADVARFMDLVETTDILLEGHRPGVMERLGIGPDACFVRNPDLIYARMTGWGQDGPLAQRAGHDINYISLTGVLSAIGTAGGPPQIPLNLLGDYAGGALYLVIGTLAALHDVKAGGGGQVIDCAMVDGAAHILNGVHAMLAGDGWRDSRGVNILDGSRPFYTVYETADGGYMAVSPTEARFFAEMLKVLGIAQHSALFSDSSRWSELRDHVATAFRSRTRDEWAALFTDTDACVTPVLSLNEAPSHAHIAARKTIRRDADGALRSAPAPRFRRYHDGNAGGD